MPISYTNTNLFDTKNAMIVHGCNACGVMGAGVAKDIRRYYPTAYMDYMAAHRSGGLILGSVVWSISEDRGYPQIIGNAITQPTYGFTGKHVDYSAITSVFKLVEEKATELDIIGVSIPKIGSSLGGGDWSVISALIDAATPQTEILVHSIVDK